MKVFVAVALLILAVNAFTDDEYGFLFNRWMVQHNKQYTNDVHTRFEIFKNNLDIIHKHNQGDSSYTLAMNKFGDMTPEEFKKYVLCMDLDKKKPFTGEAIPRSYDYQDPPESFDWTEKEGIVQKVKDQAACGSCYAFAAIGALEGMSGLEGKPVSLSEQQIVDCSNDYGNEGCNGGWPDSCFDYVKEHGICTEKEYPYKGVDMDCKADKCKQFIKTIEGYTDCEQNEKALEQMILQAPTSVGVDANSWQFYSRGILSNCGHDIDHGVLLVGYGEEKSEKFWKIKNSWGKDWGEDGFIRIKKDVKKQKKGLCDIAAAASIPHPKK